MQYRTWVFNPKSRLVPETARKRIDEWAKTQTEILKKKLIPKNPPKKYNYVADVYSEWVGGRFYLCAKYNCPGPNTLSPNFIHKFARLECIGNKYLGFDHYNLFAMRHTGKWIPIEFNVSLKTCLKTMENNGWFAIG